MTLTAMEQLIADLTLTLERIIEKAWMMGFVAGQNEEVGANDPAI